MAGAVADIHRDEVFSATRNFGARLTFEPISPTELADLDGALVATGFAYDAGLRATQAQMLTRLLPVCRDIRCMGSAALNLCWVGCGRLDAYFERDLKVYDYAAGALVAHEAGARIELPSTADRNLIIAATGGIFDSLRAILVSPND